MHVSARADWGGGPEHIYQLISHIKDDFDFYVACPNDDPYFNRFYYLLGGNRLCEIPHRKFSLRALFGICKFVLENKISLIHSHGKGGGLYGRLAALLCHVPCVHTFHGIHIGEYNVFKKWLYLVLERVLSHITNIGIAISAGERSQILHNRLFHPDRLVTVPNGVKIPYLESMVIPNANPFLVIHISRFDVAKNSEFIVDILDCLRREKKASLIKIVCIGSGIGVTQLRAKLAELCLDKYVLFTGALADPSIYFKGALCYLSTSRWEGLPLALLEAMSYNLPVVASDVVGNRDAVEDGITGFLYNLGDARAACKALLSLANNVPLAMQMGQEGRKRIEDNYDACRMASDTSQVYYGIMRHA